jgi:hypothetical protein
MNPLLVESILSVLSGLTILAYKHPDGYRIIGPIVVIALVGLLVVGAIWDVAITSAHMVLIDFLEHGKNDEALQATDGLRMLAPARIIGVFCLLAYVGFLFLLPEIVRESSQPKTTAKRRK